MRVSWIFSLIILLLTGAVVALMLLDAGSTAYNIVWGLALLSVLLMVVFYRNVLRPLRTIANGVYLLRAQDFSSRLSHVGQREADRIVDMFNSMMSSLKQERLRLREQNNFLGLLIDVSPLGIILLGQDGRMTEANKTAASFLGQEKPETMRGLRPAETDTQLGHLLDSLADDEVRVARLNDSMVYRCSRLGFMDSGYRHPFLIVEKLTDEVRKAEKKSYEMVIRMMAHEVNNSLAAVNSVLDTASDAVSDPDLTEALTACENRCHALSGFITKFASAVKIPEPVLAECRLDNLLQSWSPMLESLCASAGASLQMDTGQECLTLRLDPVLMEQAVNNIVKNAAESAGEGGLVRVSLSAGSKPVLTVSDNGPGIDADTAEMLFTPFFSTKPSGHGLGLMLVSEVLSGHGCRFSLETGEDGLTRFTIRFLGEVR